MKNKIWILILFIACFASFSYAGPVVNPSGVSVTATVTMSANQSVNESQISGVSVAMGSGTSNTGTQRVILATDQPAVPVTFTQGALPANQSVNITQINGTAPVTSGVSGIMPVGGGSATNTAVASYPVNIGAQGITAEPSAVTALYKTQLITDKVGKLIVLPYSIPENFVSGTTGVLTDTTTSTIIAAQSAGVRTYINEIFVTNGSATVGTVVTITFGSGKTWPGYAAAGGGFVCSLPTPLVGDAATAVTAACTTTGASVSIAIAGYKGL